MGQAGSLNLNIDQGATLYKVLTLKDEDGNPIDITGRTFRGQLRLSYSDPEKFDLTCNIVDGPQGQFSIELTATQTADIPVTGSSRGGVRPKTRYLWDLEMVDGSTVTRLLEGFADISPGVTR